MQSGIRAVSLFLLGLFAYGCAGERDPIDRVQIGAQKKSFFVGDIADPKDDPEYFMRTSVIAVDTGAQGNSLFTASDAQPTVRIRWEITEKEILARLSYERIRGTNPGVGKRTELGQVVAAYRIEKHFDIRRDFNPQTGEEFNIVMENDTDRPWNQREYVRIDWSTNLVTTAYELDSLSQIGLYDYVKWEPIAYAVTNPNDANRPVLDEKTGYFDVTLKAFASPGMVSDPEYGDFPACYLLGAWPRANCNPAELTLRQSFLRVADRDYEPLDIDGNRMEMFGWFTNDRYGFERGYGVVDDSTHRFASKWNLYEQSHRDVLCARPKDTTPVGKSAHRDENKDGTEDECAEVGNGSKCDEFVGKCTVPLRERKTRTIAWHVNKGFPDDLFDAGKEVVEEWNQSLRVAVLAGRLAECRRVQGADCDAEFGWPARWADNYLPPLGTESSKEVGTLFVLCHNPVDASKDDPACGADKTEARGGDLRFNMFNLIDAPEYSSPWGIMVDAEDPLSGEKISGSVNQWAAVLEHHAHEVTDIVELLNGDLPPDQLLEGKNVSSWIETLRQNENALSKEEIADRKTSFRAFPKRETGNKLQSKNPVQRRREAYQALSQAGALGPGNDNLLQRVRKLRGSALEGKLISSENLALAGLPPQATLSGAQKKLVSPFDDSLPFLRRERERAAAIGHAKRHSCRMEAGDADSLLGLAKTALKKFPRKGTDPAAVASRRDEIYKWARYTMAQGVFAHEMGHAMGLRHNFAASFDSLNYRTEYWQLRTRNGEVTTPCADGNTNGSACVGPRWKDPLTPEEIDENIGRYATTSVMDYPGDENHDQLLLGKYDRAAIRFGYGGVVDVWDSPGVSVVGSGAGKSEAFKLASFTASPGLFGVFDFATPDPNAPYAHIHYSQYQNEFKLLTSCKAGDGPLGKTCEEKAMDVVEYDRLKSFASDPAWASLPFGRLERAIDERGRVRRGYMFSSDEYANSGNVPSFAYDAGADAYEQVRFLANNYDRRYIFDSFRRKRVLFNTSDVVWRIQAHYLDPIQQISKSFFFGAMLDGDPSKPSEGFLDDGNFGALSLAATEAFNLFGKILVKPEPGSFCDATTEDCYGTQPEGQLVGIFKGDALPLPGAKYDFSIGLGAGRYVHNDFDYSKGYFWSEHPTQVGAYYDKVWATYYLAEAFDSFISNSKEDFTDGRYKNVNFATVYPEQMKRLYGSLFSGDLEAFSPWAPATATGGAQIEPLYPFFHAKGLAGARQAGFKLIDPNFGYNEQLYAMVWANMFFPANDLDLFLEDARISVFSGDQISLPAGETHAFFDPETGKLYRAHKTGTETIFGKVYEKGVAAKMLAWANNLASLVYFVDVDANGVPRPNADGSLKYLRDNAGKLRKDPDYAATEITLRRFIGNLEVMTELSRLYEKGAPSSSP